MSGINQSTQTDSQSAGDIVDEPRFTLLLRCTRKTYRRAGFIFTRGKNTVCDLTQAQRDQLCADPVLALVSETSDTQPADARGLDVLDMGGVAVPDLYARIRAAVATLDPKNPQHYTKTQGPRVASVSEALGETITAEQLKTALTGGA